MFKACQNLGAESFFLNSPIMLNLLNKFMLAVLKKNQFFIHLIRLLCVVTYSCVGKKLFTCVNVLLSLSFLLNTTSMVDLSNSDGLFLNQMLYSA